MHRLSTIVATLLNPDQRGEYDKALRGRYFVQWCAANKCLVLGCSQSKVVNGRPGEHASLGEIAHYKRDP
jgi:hypothetical protein